jgi:Dicarboxylate transport
LLRRIVRGGLAALVLLGLVALASFWLAEPALRAGLRLAGVEDLHFDRLSIGLARAGLFGLRLGPPPGQEAARLQADYRLGGLLQGRLESLTVEGLRVRGRLGEDGLELTGLARAEGTGDGALRLPLLPERLVLRDAGLELTTPAGALSLPFQMEAETGGRHARFRLQASQLRLERADGAVSGRLAIAGSVPLEDGAFRFGALDARGEMQIETSGIEVPELAHGIDASATIDAVAEQGRVILTLHGLKAQADGLRIGGASLSAAEADLEGSASFELSPEGALSALRGTARTALAGRQGTIAGLTLTGLQAEQSFDVAAEGGRIVLSLQPGGTSRLESLDWRGQVRTGPITITPRVPDDAFLVAQSEDGRLLGFEQALLAGLEMSDVRIAGEGATARAAAELRLNLSGTPDGIEQGRLLVTEGQVQVPALALRLDGVQSELTLAGAGLAPDASIPISVARITHDGEPPWFRPLTLSASLRQDPAAIELQGQLGTQGGGLDLAFRGSHDTKGGRSRLVLDGRPIRFEPQGLQPADLVPALGGVLEQVSGQAELDGELLWEGDDLRTDLVLLLDDLELTAGPARLVQVNGLVRFDRLRPPATPAGQQLSAARLDVGLPLTQGFMTFQLEPEGPLAVQQLRFRFAGGLLRAEPFSVYSDGSGMSVVLSAEGLDLARLLEEMRLPGLTGEGRISGRLPVVIEGSEALIEGGELVSDRPGWLRYRPDQPPAALQSGAQGVDLLLQALENFRYEELRVTLDGRTDAKMDIQLHIEGANPGLYDGYPVEFNLNLEGELGNILRSNLSGFHIPEPMRRRIESEP